MRTIICTSIGTGVQNYLSVDGWNAAQYNALHLLTVMVKRLPQWLANQESLYKALVARWQAPERAVRLKEEMKLPKPVLLESKRLAKCILVYIKAHHKDVQPLLELYTIFLVNFKHCFCLRGKMIAFHKLLNLFPELTAF